MDLHTITDFIAYWVLTFSIMSILLPPVEFFDDFPRFQPWYRLGCKFIKYWGSLNWRGKIIERYPSYNRAVNSNKENKQ